MLARISALFRQPRRPLAGVALAAVAGILLGEAIWLWIGGGRQQSVVDATLGVALGVFVGAGLLFLCFPRNWLCWTIVLGGFATLHLFQCATVPGLVLARILTPPAGADARKLQVFSAIGSVVDEPRGSVQPPGFNAAPDAPVAAAAWHFTFELESIRIAGQAWPCHAQVAAFWKNAGGKPLIGDRLSVIGLAGNVAGPRNPGEFDEAAYLRRRGIYSEVTMNGIADVLPAPGDTHFWQVPILGPLTQRAHDWIDATLRLDLQDEPDVSRLVTTILLGLRDSPGLGDLEPIFQRTGTLHFFAIDGLKLGFLGWLLLSALTSAGWSRKWTRALCLLLLLGYTLAAGIGPATIRAIAVAAVLLGGEWLDRPARAGNSLGAAAAALLLFDTNQLFTLGFQLSFLVVLTILTLAVPLRDWLRRIGAPDPFLPRLLFSRGLRAREQIRRVIVDLASVSTAAWSGSLPLTILAFHLVSPISILANIAVFPLAAAMFGLAVFSVCGGLVWQTWAIWMNNANWLVAKALLGALRLFDAVPGGSFHVAAPFFWHWPAPTAEITVLDLGPGRAVAVCADGVDWLIDTGRASDDRNSVLPFLQAAGIDRLAGLCLTAGDTYHLGGAPLVVTDLNPVRTVIPELLATGRSPGLRDVRRLLESRHLPASALASGQTIALTPEVRLRVLYSPAGLPPNPPTGNAMIIRVEAGGWRVLLLGDSSAGAQRWLQGQLSPDELCSDVVILGQPSKTAAGKPAARGPEEGQFLASVHPLLLIREATREASAPPRQDGPWTTVDEQTAGAVTLLAYPARLEAGGYVSGTRTVLKRAWPSDLAAGQSR